MFRTSQTGRVLNKNVEMLNYGTHPLVEDVRLLAGREALPVLADALEYDAVLPAAAHASFRACLQALRDYPGLVPSPGRGMEQLIAFFVERSCDDKHLPAIYAGHQHADAAYMQRLMQGTDRGMDVPAP